MYVNFSFLKVPLFFLLDTYGHNPTTKKMGIQHLDHDYELESKPTGLIPHFWDTIDALGGWKVRAVHCASL